MLLTEKSEEWLASLTTHVGSLPRPAKLIEAAHKRTVDDTDEELEKELKGAVADVVRLRKEAGIDLVNDGELAHTMGWAYDYGSGGLMMVGSTALRSLSTVFGRRH